MTAIDLRKRPGKASMDEGRAAVMAAPTVGSPALPRLRDAHAGLSGMDLLEAAIKTDFPGRIAAVSSFGAESARARRPTGSAGRTRGGSSALPRSSSSWWWWAV
mgnify:CR=1 FL=1